MAERRFGGVLRHMRRHVEFAQVGDKLGHIVGLVGRECSAAIWIGSSDTLA
jgi:hypothetical protein